MDASEILTRLEKLEDAFLSGLQEVRSIKAEIQKQANGNSKPRSRRRKPCRVVLQEGAEGNSPVMRR